MVRSRGDECIIGGDRRDRETCEAAGDTMRGPFSYKEHRKNRRKSNKDKHQKGKGRTKKDRPGGEKGDERRTRRK